MEHTLGEREENVGAAHQKRLNPCFSGTYSRSVALDQVMPQIVDVLILVLVEHTLGGRQHLAFVKR